MHREYHEVICRLLLEAGADATARNSYADTPLHWAAERCNYAVCKQLLDAGADPNERNHLQKTPLRFARDFNRDDVVALLLARGAELGAPSMNC